MNEIPSITSQRLKSIGIVSFVEPVLLQTTQQVNQLHTDMVKFQEGLEMAQAIKTQLEKAIDTIIPEN